MLRNYIQSLLIHKIEGEDLSEREGTVETPEKRTSNPEATLFVGRLNYSTTEAKLRETFGSILNGDRIVTIHLVKSTLTKKPRGRDGKTTVSFDFHLINVTDRTGYGFVEFNDPECVTTLVKQFTVDALEIDGRSIVLDRERARVCPAFVPRRLGGGVGPGRSVLLLTYLRLYT